MGVNWGKVVGKFVGEMGETLRIFQGENLGEIRGVLSAVGVKQGMGSVKKILHIPKFLSDLKLTSLLEPI